MATPPLCFLKTSAIEYTESIENATTALRLGRLVIFLYPEYVNFEYRDLFKNFICGISFFINFSTVSEPIKRVSCIPRICRIFSVNA